MPRQSFLEAKCHRHDFSLRPIGPKVTSPQYLNASFCDAKSRGSKKQKHSREECRSTPIFNEDGNYATPAFILQEEIVIEK